MAALKFTIPPNLEYVKEVAEETTEQEELQSFILRQGPYAEPWFPVGDGHWIQTDAIVSVEIDRDVYEPGDSFIGASETTET